MNRTARLLLTTTLLAFTSLGTSVAAEDPYAGNLLGDMGGVRPMLERNGIDLTIEYKGDAWATTQGADEGRNYLDNLDIQFAVDGSKAFGIEGNTLYLSFLNNFGNGPNAKRIGGVQGVDNIETDPDTFKLYEAYVEQSLFNNTVLALVGIRDLNADFAVNDMAGNFIMPPMGIMQSFSQTGQNGPSIFPTPGLATRLKFNTSEETYFSVAAFEGIPGNPNNGHGNHLNLNGKEGALLVGEVGWVPPSPDGLDGEYNKLAVGAWRYTKEFDDNAGTSTDDVQGVYLLSSYQFYHDAKAARGLGAFLRAGYAAGNAVQSEWDYQVGLVGQGWLPTRAAGEFGLGFSQATNSSDFMINNAGSDRAEYQFEAYYRDEVYHGISLQPDFQYIVNPGTVGGENASVFGLRLGANL